MFRLGYNTNGLAHHRAIDALRLCAELGYEGLAITPDVGQLDLYRLSSGELIDLRRWSDELGLELAIETGARFLLDARRKHRPNLLEEEANERERRVDFLLRSVDLAHELGSGVVSLWAGRAPADEVCEDRDLDPGRRSQLLDRLAEGLETVLEHATQADVQLAFEPEPGMFIERVEGYGSLVEHMGDAADSLGLCLDVGHLVVSGDLPVGDVIRTWASRLVHVHLDDAVAGIHEHRMFGEGQLDLPQTLAALAQVGFDGMAAVELSRHSHRGAEAAREAMQHLRAAIAASPG